MKEPFLRRLAGRLLRAAIRVAPKPTVGWAQAMLGELSHVKGNWPALLWAIGGTWVTVKQVLFSVFKARDSQEAHGEEIFGKEPQMRKTTLTAVGACVIASLFFFLAPVFRQAFRVSLAQWDAIVHMEPGQRQGSLIALGRRAEQDHDAEALAFVAARLVDASESARLADEAVQLDPGLTWLYAIVAVNSPERPEIQRWIPELTKWDSDNALLYLIAAESIDIDEAPRRSFFLRPEVEDESLAWQNSMAAAFRSPKLDTYRSRLKALDRTVVGRYGFTDIYQIVPDEWQDGLPTYADSDSYRYAKSVLKEGKLAEYRGDHRGAVEKYLGVARFIQVVAGPGQPPHYRMSRIVQGDTYRQLAVWAERDAQAGQSAFYASLADSIAPTNERELRFLSERISAGGAGLWNAVLVRISGAMMMLCAILFLLGVSYFLIRASSSQPKTRFSSRLSRFLSIGGAAGLLVSSLTLYLNYRPYAEILKRYLRTGDESRMHELSEFLRYTQFPFGVPGFSEAIRIMYYFWAGVTLLCLASLLFVLVRYSLNRSRTTAAI